MDERDDGGLTMLLLADVCVLVSFAWEGMDEKYQGIDYTVKYAVNCRIKWVVTISDLKGNKKFFVINITQARDIKHLIRNLNACAGRLLWV